jgi:hypothetical protein
MGCGASADSVALPSDSAASTAGTKRDQLYERTASNAATSASALPAADRRDASAAALQLEPTASAAAAAQKQHRCAHAVLSRPAFLSHIFKFAVRRHKDVKLLCVNRDWEETAVTYCPWMWTRLARARFSMHDEATSKHVIARWPLLFDVDRGPGERGKDPDDDDDDDDHAENDCLHATSVESFSHQLFNAYICSVWVYKSYTPSVLSRLVAPRAIDLSHSTLLVDQEVFHRQSYAWDISIFSDHAWPPCLGSMDKYVAHISQFTQLRSLKLRRCFQLTDAGLRHLSALTQLLDLDLGDCEITDYGISHLRSFTALVRLDLSGCSLLTDAGLAHVSVLTALRSLQLARCEGILCTDAGVVHICKLSLRRLDLFSSKLSDAALQHVSKISTLQRLDIFRCDRVSDAGLAYLRDLPLLRWLSVSGCAITEAGVEHISKISKLEVLLVDRRPTDLTSARIDAAHRARSAGAAHRALWWPHPRVSRAAQAQRNWSTVGVQLDL